MSKAMRSNIGTDFLPPSAFTGRSGYPGGLTYLKFFGILTSIVFEVSKCKDIDLLGVGELLHPMERKTGWQNLPAFFYNYHDVPFDASTNSCSELLLFANNTLPRNY